ncbi:MAG: hypothetical protein AAF549_06870 [Pseudomonadota bacterium]
MKIFIALIILLSSSVPSWADYYVWEDSKTGLSATFPDRWEHQTNRNPVDVLTIEAPSANDDAVCKIKAIDDKRYTIFPASKGNAVQKVAVSIPFWKSYMAHYDDFEIARVYDGGSLGQWIASYATFSYTARDGSVSQSRRGIGFASLYYDNLYIIECSSLSHAYERWDNDFKSVIKSVDFKRIYHSHKEGEYESFLNNAKQYFWAQTGPEGTIGYK